MGIGQFATLTAWATVILIVSIMLLVHRLNKGDGGDG